MPDEQLTDEDVYFSVREEQLSRRLERAGHTRRGLLHRGAAGRLLLAGAARPAAPARARVTPTTSPIVKPLPPEWFIDYGTNAEMRWDSPAGTRSRLAPPTAGGALKRRASPSTRSAVCSRQS